eukprot:tig00021433_g21293.t1
MLRQNRDTDDGLVNGAIGLLAGYKWRDHTETPDYISQHATEFTPDTPLVLEHAAPDLVQHELDTADRPSDRKKSKPKVSKDNIVRAAAAATRQKKQSIEAKVEQLPHPHLMPPMTYYIYFHDDRVGRRAITERCQLPDGRIVDAVEINVEPRNADHEDEIAGGAGGTHNVRIGPPFRVAYGTTVYKAQGHTLKRAIADVRGMNSRDYTHRQQLYVMLSRPREGAHFFIANASLLQRYELLHVIQNVNPDLQAAIKDQKAESAEFARLRQDDPAMHATMWGHKLQYLRWIEDSTAPHGQRLVNAVPTECEPGDWGQVEQFQREFEKAEADFKNTRFVDTMPKRVSAAAHKR